MRIVQALGSSRKGGAEGFFVRLAIALHQRGVAQTTVVRRGSWAEAQLSKAGVSAETAMFGGGLDFLTQRRLKRTLREPPADIALTWMRRAAAACPTGPWLHVGRLGNYYKLDAFARCDHLIGNTPAIVSYLADNGWAANRVTYVPNFVPHVSAQPMQRVAFDTVQTSPLILWIGRMEHEKGPDVVLRALALVPGATLWMAGDGSYLGHAKALANDLGLMGRVRFLGWQDDVHSLLKTADLFVCASRNEALGNIVLEAWSHGVPIIATRSPGPEYLIADGETGVLVPNADHEALSGAINRMLADRDFARRIGQAGLHHFNATFTEDRVVKQYLDLFARLIHDRKARTVRPG